MTYMVTRRYRRPRRAGLGDAFEDLAKQLAKQWSVPTPEGQCIDAANQALAPFDAKIDDLAKTWQPTGFYTPQEIRDIASATMKVVQQAQASVNQAASEPNALQESVMRATDDLARASGRVVDYLEAARATEQQGLRVVNAAGFKRWVIDTMATASSAMVTAAVIGCVTPWWVGALAQFQAAFDVAWGVAKKIVGATLAVGETALKIVSDLPDLYDLIKWPAILLGGYWLWREFGPKPGHAP